MIDKIKRRVFAKVLRGREDVYTDPVASPTGFPFKIVRLEGTLSEDKEYQQRERLCDLGYLRTAYKRKDGTVGYRCPGEPEGIYLQKDGKPEDMPGRKCICNGLMADVGLAQNRADGYTEKPLVTSGDDLSRIALFLKGDKLSYKASDVIQYLLGRPSSASVPA